MVYASEQTIGGWLRLLRRYPRVRLETVVAAAHEGRALLAHSIDICEAGMGLELPALLPEGACISVSFYLPTSHEVIELQALIVHPVQRRNGQLTCGLAFTHVDAQMRRLLRRYINMRRFLHGDLRPPTDNPTVSKRMTERLGKVRRLTLLT